jgi:hypothetical protein
VLAGLPVAAILKPRIPVCFEVCSCCPASHDTLSMSLLLLPCWWWLTFGGVDEKGASLGH